MKLEELFSRKAEGHNYCNHEDIKIVVNKEAPVQIYNLFIFNLI